MALDERLDQIFLARDRDQVGGAYDTTLSTSTATNQPSAATPATFGRFRSSQNRHGRTARAERTAASYCVTVVRIRYRLVDAVR